MVAKKLTDWYAVTHATCCPRKQNFCRVRFISDKKFCLIGCNNLRKIPAIKMLIAPSGREAFFLIYHYTYNLRGNFDEIRSETNF